MPAAAPHVDPSTPAAATASYEMESLIRRNAALEDLVRRSREELVRFGSDAERSEERLTNKLLARLGQLRLEKEKLAMNVEREEEFLTNTLQRKLRQLQQDKVDLENKLESEQEFMVNRLQRQLEVANNATADKVQLENELEQEQEYIVNRLQKQVLAVKIEKKKVEQRMLDEMVAMVSSLEAYAEDPQMMKHALATAKEALHERVKAHKATGVAQDTSDTTSLNNEVLLESVSSRHHLNRRGTL
ncbi:hypothetical protein DYB25_001307 [Aphanomyces astaci]|uniref:Uncharacterized protein n=1 Tax=Aphanomyces astaci TaxID=112090 RepID=A0A397ES62_APHAT|nr:hypothetical protein DYB25_001307 [Aphanomyces astaci]RHY43777.1 hypothetical protein DYB30_010129 [Aphanomyces astaci]RHY58159.1 hypothetical protein DYB34_003287 [Aphanomyces astaci]RHY96058.1 hypothetical protein DYB31_015635 [Aphanomyces astaci]RHZ31373.1 hypothetical protein DYB26_000817 [Aphanomyces astaci]